MNSFRYRHTNCFFVEGAAGKLLAIDAGWPCSLAEYQRGLKEAGGRIQDVGLVIVTHLHLDHAGLVGEFQHLGIEVLVFEHQADQISAMEGTIAKGPEYRGYRPIDRRTLVEVSSAESARELGRRGFPGEVMATPGHSVDSVSYLLHGEAVIGDLPIPDQLSADDLESRATWERLIARGVRTVYPSHSPTLSRVALSS